MEKIIETYRQYWNLMESSRLDAYLLLGLALVIGQLFSRFLERVKLPSLVGLLLAGILLGTSGFNLINSHHLEALHFIPDIALALVALSLGLELKFVVVRSLGIGIITVILFESLLTFTLIALGTWLVSGSIPLGLAAGAVGAASAPTSPLATVKEYRARGPLCNATFAITGFDDTIGIIIFSFASTIAYSLYAIQNGLGLEQGSLAQQLLVIPLLEIFSAVLCGGILGVLYKILTRKLRHSNMFLLWTLAMIFLAQGISYYFEFSLILTNMVMGIVVINLIHSTQQEKILRSLEGLMPSVFTLFFVITGARLNISTIPGIGWIGLTYIICRTAGKWIGASGGALAARLEPNIRRFAWTGLLSQIGVGIGLSLVLVEKFRPLGAEATAMAEQILVIVTATSLVFEIIAPMIFKWGLTRAGEIPLGTHSSEED